MSSSLMTGSFFKKPETSSDGKDQFGPVSVDGHDDGIKNHDKYDGNNVATATPTFDDSEEEEDEFGDDLTFLSVEDEEDEDDFFDPSSQKDDKRAIVTKHHHNSPRNNNLMSRTFYNTYSTLIFFLIQFMVASSNHAGIVKGRKGDKKRRKTKKTIAGPVDESPDAAARPPLQDDSQKKQHQQHHRQEQQPQQQQHQEQQEQQALVVSTNRRNRDGSGYGVPLVETAVMTTVHAVAKWLSGGARGGGNYFLDEENQQQLQHQHQQENQHQHENQHQQEKHHQYENQHQQEHQHQQQNHNQEQNHNQQQNHHHHQQYQQKQEAEGVTKVPAAGTEAENDDNAGKQQAVTKEPATNDSATQQQTLTDCEIAGISIMSSSTPIESFDTAPSEPIESLPAADISNVADQAKSQGENISSFEADDDNNNNNIPTPANKQHEYAKDGKDNATVVALADAVASVKPLSNRDKTITEKGFKTVVNDKNGTFDVDGGANIAKTYTATDVFSRSSNNDKINSTADSLDLQAQEKASAQCYCGCVIC